MDCICILHLGAGGMSLILCAYLGLWRIGRMDSDTGKGRGKRCHHGSEMNGLC